MSLAGPLSSIVILNSNTEPSSSSTTIQIVESNKASQEDPLKLESPIPSSASEPPTISKECAPDSAGSQIIRSGKVRLKGQGSFNWSWRAKWLELREQSLTIHSRKGSPHQVIIRSQDIVTIEPTSIRPHCLLLEVKGKKYWLLLESDEELYGWLDDVIHRCHLSVITSPENFAHHVHVIYDYIADRFQGLPIQWQKIFDESSDCMEEDDEIESISGVALQNPRIIGPKFILRRPPSLYPDRRILDRGCDIY